MCVAAYEIYLLSSMIDVCCHRKDDGVPAVVGSS